MLYIELGSEAFLRVHFVLGAISGGRGGGGRWRLEGGYKRMCNRKIEDPVPKANPGHHPSALKFLDSCISCQSVRNELFLLIGSNPLINNILQSNQLFV